MPITVTYDKCLAIEVRPAVQLSANGKGWPETERPDSRHGRGAGPSGGDLPRRRPGLHEIPGAPQPAGAIQVSYALGERQAPDPRRGLGA